MATIVSSTKSLILYLVRLGGFNKPTCLSHQDIADQGLQLPASATWEEMFNLCCKELQSLPPKVGRRYLTWSLLTWPPPQNMDFSKVITEVKSSGHLKSTKGKIKIMQWNLLAQALAEGSDCFSKCPKSALSWSTRRWRLLEEMILPQPDVYCLQEVDHFQFLEKTLGSLGFKGVFCAKPDSPCLHAHNNNGPDGCAIFWNDQEWELMDEKSRILEVWGSPTNQVALMVRLKRRNGEKSEFDANLAVEELNSSDEVTIITTHLKARKGTLQLMLRQEQGKDLLRWAKEKSEPKCPLVLTGDFNAEPNEPVYRLITSDAELKLDSSYAALSPYTLAQSYLKEITQNSNKEEDDTIIPSRRRLMTEVEVFPLVNETSVIKSNKAIDLSQFEPKLREMSQTPSAQKSSKGVVLQKQEHNCELDTTEILNEAQTSADSSFHVMGPIEVFHFENENEADDTQREPPYTTWKIREKGGEICHTIDYIFYSKNQLEPIMILGLPNSDQIGPERIPSFTYPSDHFSLVTEFEFKENVQKLNEK